MPLLRPILLMLWALGGATGARAEVMTWAIQDFPPIYIPVNGQPGDGMNDVVLNMIIQRMPGLEHRYVVANPARVFALLDAGEAVCYLGGLRTADLERRFYLTNVKLAPPLQLIVRTAVLDRLPLDSQGQVRLPALLAQPSMRGLLVNKRSYGQQIDAQIGAAPAGTQRQLLSPSGVGANFLEMLAHGRADYAIEHDFMLSYRRQQEPGRFDLLTAVPIAGNDELAIVAMVCPRTPWGRRAIVQIDAILAELARGPELGPASIRWFGADTLRRFGPQMEAFLARRRSPADPAEFR